MSFGVGIGGVVLRLEAPATVHEAFARRFGGFVVDADDAHAVLEIATAGSFDPALTRPAAARMAAQDRGVTLDLDGTQRGFFDLDARRGRLEAVADLGQVDALVRAALALLLPVDGALLLHGALVPVGAEARVFVGESGAGKSTVARAFDAACDELVVLRDGEAWATPYWSGRPFRARVRELVCLRRADEAPALRLLDGMPALRLLARHVVRYAPVPEVEAAILPLLAAASRLPLVDAACPVGDAFVPFVERHLGAA